MKKIVPTLLLTIAMLSGKSQTSSIWFNELMPDPAQNNDEYIELFNTSTSEISLDCYVILSYFETKTEKGFYVYNFPENARINGLSHYVISSNNPVRFKDRDNDKEFRPQDETSFNNWNNIGPGGYMHKYTYTNNKWNEPTPVESNFENFMDIAYGLNASLLLYRINSDGTTSYVNGFFGNTTTQSSDLSGMLTTIGNFESLPILPSSSCAAGFTSVPVVFNGISNRHFDLVSLREATGRGNGYAKKGDGLCGEWVKTEQGEFSPGTKNAVETAVPTISTVENYVCDKIVFSITSGPSSFFPVEVKLYYDYGTIGTFDISDVLVSSQTITSSNPNQYYSFPVAVNTQPVLVVYQSATGCFNKIAAPTPRTTTINIAGYFSCTLNANNKTTVTYSITNAVAIPYPIQLKCFDDNGTPANVNDDIEIASEWVNITPSQTYTAELMNVNSNVIVTAQIPELSCITAQQRITNSCNTSILPVKFQSFTAARDQKKKEQVVLQWKTASEQNNRGFYIQRKTSGEWKNIAFILSQAENGNSTSILTYAYFDMNASSDPSQYRIQQVDFDGKTDYSELKTVLGTGKNSSNILIYPNPGINGKVNLLFRDHSGTKSVMVIDINGRVVKQFPKVTDSGLTIDGLQKGFYSIKIIDQASLLTTVEKVIIEK